MEKSKIISKDTVTYNRLIDKQDLNLKSRQILAALISYYRGKGIHPTQYKQSSKNYTGIL